MTVKRTMLLLLIALPLTAETFGNLEDIQVTRVYDGDTFFADISHLHPLLGDDIGIRLRGADTPEIRGSCEREKELARAARDLAEKHLMSAGRVDLVSVERGKYFRIIATVMVDGADLSRLLIGNKLAVPYDGTEARFDWCEG